MQAEDGDLSQFDLKSVGAALSMDDWEEGSYEVPIKISLPEGYKLLEDVTAEIKISKVFQCRQQQSVSNHSFGQGWKVSNIKGDSSNVKL